MHAADFQLITRHLYKMGSDEILRCFVLEHEFLMILNEAHVGVKGGHYAQKATVPKILQEGLWWPTMHANAQDDSHNYDVFQRTGKSPRRDEMSLVPQIPL